MTHYPLWRCPVCGIVGRLMHRYLEPHPKTPDDGERVITNPGKCNPKFINPFIGDGI